MTTPQYEFRFQRGSANRWVELDPILGAGEPGVEIDTGLFKIGDGHTTWNDLEYFLTEPYVTGIVEVIIAESGGLSSDPRVGDLADLTTGAKDLIVSAINEVNASMGELGSLVVNLALPFYLPFGRPGNLAVFTGPRVYFPDNVEFLGATITVTTAPTGSPAIFEVLKNGSGVFSVDPTISPSGFLASAGTLAGPTMFDARTDYLQVQCTQVGSTVPGADLTMALKMAPV
jgi:hypothetical protein